MNTRTFFEAGFRPFFLFAALYAVISQLAWMGLYVFHTQGDVHGVALYSWHAHEMIYGYCMAVVAGFLLTAARNWTGQKTLDGPELALLVLLWTLPRALFWVNEIPLFVIAISDIAFNAYLLFAIARPVFKVQQWRQKIILGILALALIGNVAFYFAHLGGPAVLLRISLYGSLYILVGLIILMGRRVIPMFSKNGVPGCTPLQNHEWLDKVLPLVFIACIITDIASPNNRIGAALSAIMSILMFIRLAGWYRNAFWSWPMVWILHVALFWVAFGFALKASSHWLGISPYLALHALAYGAVGSITIGMMARVSLGHTGRSVTQPPMLIKWSFILITIGTIIRVITPIFLPEYYINIILIAQIFWIMAFALFVFVYTPYLLKPRI